MTAGSVSAPLGHRDQGRIRWVRARAVRAHGGVLGMRSTNPVLSRPDVFSRAGYAAQPGVGQGPPVVGERRVGLMTLESVIERTAALLIVAGVTGAMAWVSDAGPGLAIGAALAGLLLAVVNSFR